MKEKKLSIFHITSIILTIILVVFIIVSIAIIIDLKNKTDATKDKNNELTQNLSTNNKEITKIQKNYLKNIEKYKN